MSARQMGTRVLVRRELCSPSLRPSGSGLVTHNSGPCGSQTPQAGLLIIPLGSPSPWLWSVILLLTHVVCWPNLDLWRVFWFLLSSLLLHVEPWCHAGRSPGHMDCVVCALWLTVPEEPDRAISDQVPDTWLKKPPDDSSLQPLRSLPVVCVLPTESQMLKNRATISNWEQWRHPPQGLSLTRKAIWEQPLFTGTIMWPQQLLWSRFFVTAPSWPKSLRFLC